ncbi:MAG: RluA family pseudouridine synthase [bacterium]
MSPKNSGPISAGRISLPHWRISKRARAASEESDKAVNATISEQITNIAAYRFAELSDLKTLRERLISLCREERLKGTILLSTEGINLFVAGSAEGIDHLLRELHSLPGLEDLTPKFSLSECQPFSRMLVRIKKEIIAFGVDGINPARRTSPKLPAATLKQWLDEGRKITLLDTRNDYEIKLGTFRGALPAGIDHFRDFPKAVAQLPESLKDEPVVMFCTGGIRCEKAGPYMESQGFRNIHQLDGGILKYFEECGGAHYDGECFVFDQRVGVDPALRETDSSQCFRCLSPLTAQDQADPRYVAGKSCPYCFKSPAEEMTERIAQREAAIQKATTPLPGSTPCDNFRPIAIPLEADGQTLLETLCGIFSHTPREVWIKIFDDACLLDSARQPATPTRLVRAGERFYRKIPADLEPDVDANIRILHEDEAILVLNKPTPLPIHPSGRYNRNTLQAILHTVYHPQKPRPAHRLDANTSGIVVFTRTRHFAKFVQPQFERGEVEKTYLARVLGHPAEDLFSCSTRIGDAPVSAGARLIDETTGLPAQTDFRVLRRDADGTALLEVRPLTGRTNQIRVHLWHLGFPIYGDPIYLPGNALGNRQTLSLGEPPMCLHAWKLKLRHPLTKETVSFEAPPPAWSGA